MNRQLRRIKIKGKKKIRLTNIFMHKQMKHAIIIEKESMDDIWVHIIDQTHQEG